MMIETPEFRVTEQVEFPNRSNVGETEAEVSLVDLLIVLAERKQVIFRTTLVFAVLAIIVSMLLPASYTATVTLLPPQQNSSMGAALASQLGGMAGMSALAGGGLGLKNPNDKYIALFKSRTVEDAMVRHFDLGKEYHKHYFSDARKAFENHSTVDAGGKDDLIHISIDDHNPIRAAELANGYVDQFRDLSQHLAITEASQRRFFFEQELEQAKDKLANAEEAMKETEQKTGLIQPDSQARALIQSAVELRAQVAAKEVQLQGMQIYATGQNSQLIQTQSELASLRAQLFKLGGSEDNSSGGLLVPKGKVPEASLEYIRKLRDVKYQETIFDILARQYEVAKLDEAKEGALIQVIDPAIPPERRSSPKRVYIVLGAAVLGFIVGVFAALLQAGLRNMRADPELALKLSHLQRAASGNARNP